MKALMVIFLFIIFSCSNNTLENNTIEEEIYLEKNNNFDEIDNSLMEIVSLYSEVESLTEEMNRESF